VSIFDSTGSPVQSATTVTDSWTPPALLNAADQPFHWYVQANYSNGGSSLPPANVLTARSFTVTPFTPAAASPQPTAPANGSAWARLPALSWTAVTGASYYKVSLGVADTGIVVEDSTRWRYPAASLISDKIGGLSTLSPGAYDWFVTAYDASDVMITTGATGNYVITDTLLGADDYHIAGCNNTVCAGLNDTPTFSWTPTTNPNFAGFYYVEIATDPNLNNIVYEYQTQYTTMTPPNSLLDSQAGQAYYWFVRPCKTRNACGALGPTAPVSFEKASKPVTLISPADEASASDAITFRWTDYLDTNGQAPVATQEARQYHVQVSTTADFATVLDEATVDAPSYTASGKTYPEGPLWWRVQAIDGSNNTLTWSTPRALTKSSDAPSLTAPADGQTQPESPVLSWQPQPYAASYDVQVYKDNDSNFSSANLVYQASTKQASFNRTATLPVAALPYVWRVRRDDADSRPGLWSGPRTFVVQGTAPDLQSPVDGARVDPRNLQFTWGAVQGAAKYRFQRSANKTSNAEQTDSVMLAWSPIALYPDGTWWWRVAALDSDGHVLANSPWHSILIDITAPNVVTKAPTSSASITGSWVATFSEPVDNVDAATLTLRARGSATPVSAQVSLSADKMTATLKPTSALVPGQTYTLTAANAITDLAGNPLATTSWAARTSTIVEQNSPAIYEGWDRDSANAALGNGYSSSATAGATETLRFTGSSVSLLATRGPDGGYANVHVDSRAAAKVSFYAAARQYQRAVYTLSGLNSGAHTLVVSVLGTRPRASSGAYVYVDGAGVGATSVDDSNAAWTARFRKVTTSNAFGGSYDTESFTAAADSGAMPLYRLTFAGTHAAVYATRTPRSGKAYVSIDGVRVATIDLYSASTSYRANVFSSRTLTSGSHTIVVTFAGTHRSGSGGTGVSLDQVSIG